MASALAGFSLHDHPLEPAPVATSLSISWPPSFMQGDELGGQVAVLKAYMHKNRIRISRIHIMNRKIINKSTSYYSKGDYLVKVPTSTLVFLQTEKHRGYQQTLTWAIR